MYDIISKAKWLHTLSLSPDLVYFCYIVYELFFFKLLIMGLDAI